MVSNGRHNFSLLGESRNCPLNPTSTPLTLSCFRNYIVLHCLSKTFRKVQWKFSSPTSTRCRLRLESASENTLFGGPFGGLDGHYTLQSPKEMGQPTLGPLFHLINGRMWMGGHLFDISACLLRNCQYNSLLKS